MIAREMDRHCLTGLPAAAAAFVAAFGTGAGFLDALEHALAGRGDLQTRHARAFAACVRHGEGPGLRVRRTTLRRYSSDAGIDLFTPGALVRLIAGVRSDATPAALIRQSAMG